VKTAEEETLLPNASTIVKLHIEGDAEENKALHRNYQARRNASELRERFHDRGRHLPYPRCDDFRANQQPFNHPINLKKHSTLI